MKMNNLEPTEIFKNIFYWIIESENSLQKYIRNFANYVYSEIYKFFIDNNIEHLEIHKFNLKLLKLIEEFYKN